MSKKQKLKEIENDIHFFEFRLSRTENDIIRKNIENELKLLYKQRDELIELEN